MEKKQLIEELEKARRQNKCKTSILCAYINMILRGNQVEVLYDLFQEVDEKATAILIRNILKQFIKIGPSINLKFEEIKSNSKNQYLVNQYKSVVRADSEIYYDAFLKICEII